MPYFWHFIGKQKIIKLEEFFWELLSMLRSRRKIYFPKIEKKKKSWTFFPHSIQANWYLVCKIIFCKLFLAKASERNEEKKKEHWEESKKYSMGIHWSLKLILLFCANPRKSMFEIKYGNLCTVQRNEIESRNY